MILLTAAAISGVRPGASAARLGWWPRRTAASRGIRRPSVRDRREGCAVVRVDDQARDFVGLVGNDVLSAETS